MHVRIHHRLQHPFETLKRVDTPTTYIDEAHVARVPKRADMFARAQFGDMGKANQKMATGGHYVRKAAPSMAQRRMLGAFVPLQDGDPHPDKAKPAPQAHADAIKAASYLLGIDAVGISRCPDWTWYSHDARGERGDHRGGEAERCTRAAQKADSEGRDHDPAQWLVRAKAGHACTACAQAQEGHAAIVIGVADRERRQAIEGPSRGAPVKQAIGRGPFNRFGRALGQAEGRGLEIVRPFDRGPVHQACANAGAEQHGRPAQRIELLDSLLPAQTHLAIAAERQPEKETDQDDAQGEIERSDLFRDEVIDLGQQDRPGVRVDDQSEAHQSHKAGAHRERDPVCTGGQGQGVVSQPRSGHSSSSIGAPVEIG